MALKVALIVGNEHDRQRLFEFVSSQRWKVAKEFPEFPACQIPHAGNREGFDAVVAYQLAGGTHVFVIRYCDQKI